MPRATLRPVIDLHSHILPWLDDGARNLDEAVGIARSMALDGIEVVAATPHVRSDYPTTPDGMEEALARVRAAVSEAGIEIDIRGGGEIALEQLARLDGDTLARFGLGGNPKLLLIEYPYVDRPPSLVAECERLRRNGIVPVIAHPERNPSIQERPADLEGAVRAGAVVQLTAASVDGRLGRACARCARTLLDLELAHLIASDAHSPGTRQAGLSDAVAAVGCKALAGWLTSDVPRALLASEELPARPASRTGRLRRSV
jgi:protein-tyrosine phosphatase